MKLLIAPVASSCPRPLARITLFPYTTLFRSLQPGAAEREGYSADRGRVGLLHGGWRSEEHTSELQSRGQLVCRLRLEKQKRMIEQAGRLALMNAQGSGMIRFDCNVSG